MMENNAQVIAKGPQHTLSMNPKKFALWLFFGTVIMLFGGLTSAFIVKTSNEAIQDIQLPGSLLYSTIIIIVSSVTMQLSLVFAKKDELKKITLFVALTLILGITFMLFQYFSWEELVQHNVNFASNNATGSFIYVFTGLHGLHIISALIFLIVVLISSIRFEIHSKKLSQMEMCVSYWHFLGILWVYLYVFLLSYF